MATTPNAFVQHAQHATAPVPRLATIRFRMWCVQEGAGVIAWVRSPRVSSLKVVPLVEEKIGREVPCGDKTLHRRASGRRKFTLISQLGLLGGTLSQDGLARPGFLPAEGARPCRTRGRPGVGGSERAAASEARSCHDTQVAEQNVPNVCMCRIGERTWIAAPRGKPSVINRLIASSSSAVSSICIMSALPPPIMACSISGLMPGGGK